MGAHDDEAVHPGGLKFYFPKRAAASPRAPTLPKPAEVSAVVKEDSDSPVTKDTGVRMILRSLRNVAESAKRSPGELLRKTVHTIKTANATPTTTEVARQLEVNAEPWLDLDVHPILLMRDLTRLYGQEWLSWEPETIWSEVAEDERLSTPIPRENRDKVMAVRTAIKSDFPWKRFEVFENVAHAFTGMVPRFDVMQPLEPYQAAFAIDVLHKIHPGIDLDDDVLGYLAALLLEDGISWGPPELFGNVEPPLAILRGGRDDTARAVEAAWGAGADADDDDAVDSQIKTLRAIGEYLAGMEEQLELTEPLPPQEYDAEADPTMPSLPEPGISAGAAGGP